MSKPTRDAEFDRWAPWLSRALAAQHLLATSYAGSIPMKVLAERDMDAV
jgi:hypothetical protein